MKSICWPTVNSSPTLSVSYGYGRSRLRLFLSKQLLFLHDPLIIKRIPFLSFKFLNHKNLVRTVFLQPGHRAFRFRGPPSSRHARGKTVLS